MDIWCGRRPYHSKGVVGGNRSYGCGKVYIALVMVASGYQDPFHSTVWPITARYVKAGLPDACTVVIRRPNPATCTRRRLVRQARGRCSRSKATEQRPKCGLACRSRPGPKVWPASLPRPLSFQDHAKAHCRTLLKARSGKAARWRQLGASPRADNCRKLCCLAGAQPVYAWAPSFLWCVAQRPSA